MIGSVMVKLIRFDGYGVVGQPRGMMTEERLCTLHSPESDWNSNNLDSTASYLSNTSSQDVDFVQDHSDYQWFLDYGYRESQHRSILSLSASYEEGCYDDLARDLDSQLAQVDMEDFRAEDILNNLPAICCQNPQGREAQCESMCKSGPLFSPVRESPMCLVDTNYSVDSLDCEEQDILLTCQANKDNYTIAFEGSTIMGEDSESHETGDSNTSTTWSSGGTQQSEPPQGHMAISDAPRTTWCKVVTQRNHHYSNMRHSSASLPNLTRAKNQLNQSIVDQRSKAFEDGCVKLYDVTHSSSVSGSENSLSSDHHNSRFSLVRLFIKQRGNIMAHSDYTSTRSIQLCNNKLNKHFITSDRNQNQLSEWMKGAIVNSFADSLIDKGVDAYSESVERVSESVSVCSCEASLITSREINCYNNNNNSLDKEQISSPEQKLRDGSVTHASLGSSSCSDPTSVTRITNNILHSGRQCPVHCIDVSMQTSATISGKPLGISKPDPVRKQSVYVMYPNYTLPDLGFLRDDCLDFEQVFLTPLQFSTSWSPLSSPSTAVNPDIHLHKRQRPYSSADIDHLYNGSFSHVQDWESLAFLLPSEYCMILAGIPELKNYQEYFSTTKPVFYGSTKTNTTKSGPFPDGCTNVNNSSSSSTATQPSSGYRGSSTLLTDSSVNISPAPQTNGLQNPLFVYRYESISSESGYSGPPLPKRSISLPDENSCPAPPRPPLPRSILRNTLENAKLHKNQANKKRHSTGMFDIQTANNNNEANIEDLEKKLKFKSSLGDISILSGYDEGVGTDVWRPPTPPTTHALRLQQLLEVSGDQWDPQEMDILRQQISRFLSLGRTKSVSFADKGEDKILTPPNSPQACAAQKVNYPVNGGSALNETTINEDVEVSFSQEILKQSFKSVLVDAVTVAAAKIALQVKNCGTTCSDLIANMTLSSLCPSLYSLLSDGLRPTLETPFGQINNSVWQVVEASAQQGPMTKALNELVLKLNSEDVLIEGVVKFNAFIFGLLNVQGLDVWFSYLRTRESVLRRHYSPNALILCACRGQPNARVLSDKLLTSLKPLAQYTFKLDLLYETRLLHKSFLQLNKLPSSPSQSSSSTTSSLWALRGLIDSPPPESVRPRSCIDSIPSSSTSDLAATAHKRWSGINIGGKLSQAFEILADDTEEEYTDSLETGAGKDVGVDSEGSGKFRRLQMKWEMLSGKENPSQNTSPNCSPVKSCGSSIVHKSRIPRPVTSPVTPANQSPNLLQNTKPAVKKPMTNTNLTKRPSVIPTRARFLEGPMKTRTSRVDTPSKTGPFPRPSSLPYRAQRAPDNHRRAVSSSTIRQATRQSYPPNKFVVTLSHRLPSESGHLAYNEGERLRLVLEVDDTWLLCCRGEAKGLVPKSAVILLPNKI